METAERLKAYASPTPDRWREEAENRRANKEWLRYSQHIAMRILDRMEQLGLTQKALAERMGCTQQYVSKILRGRENLSIETLYKLQTSLEMPILQEVCVDA